MKRVILTLALMFTSIACFSQNCDCDRAIILAQAIRSFAIINGTILSTEIKNNIDKVNQIRLSNDQCASIILKLQVFLSQKTNFKQGTDCPPVVPCPTCPKIPKCPDHPKTSKCPDCPKAAKTVKCPDCPNCPDCPDCPTERPALTEHPTLDTVNNTKPIVSVTRADTTAISPGSFTLNPGTEKPVLSEERMRFLSYCLLNTYSAKLQYKKEEIEIGRTKRKKTGLPKNKPLTKLEFSFEFLDTLSGFDKFTGLIIEIQPDESAQIQPIKTTVKELRLNRQHNEQTLDFPDGLNLGERPALRVRFLDCPAVPKINPTIIKLY